MFSWLEDCLLVCLLACLLVNCLFCVSMSDPALAASVTLFSASGSSGSFKNTWSGWYSSQHTVSSGNGKRSTYNTMPLSTIRFSDASGSYAEYKLNSGFAGKPLLLIVQKCMGSNRHNRGGTRWRNGYCTNAGTLKSSGGSIRPSTHLRIGVGDGGSDSADWCLFMPLSGNGNGDYNGNRIWCFGSEHKTNTGYTGTVMITTTRLTSGAIVPHFNAIHQLCALIAA